MGDGMTGSGLPVADPREAELRLWEAFRHGVLVDLRSGEDWDTDGPAHADRWDESRHVRAAVVQALLLGAVDPAPGYVAGVRLSGALIKGSVNLRQGVVGCVAELMDCHFDDDFILTEARTRAVDLSGSVLNTLDATSAEISGSLTLEGCQARAVRSTLAHVTGDFSLNGAHLVNTGDAALSGDRMTVDGNMTCDEGFRAEGEVTLAGAHIGGQFTLNGAHLANPGKYALSGDRMSIGNSMFCREGFRAEGAIRLLGAHIIGSLSFVGAHLANPRDEALNGDDLTVGASMFCREGFRAEGIIRLVGAHIGGQLDFSGAHLKNPGDEALIAEAATIDGDMFCRFGFQAEGTVRLLGAHIGGQLGFSSATLSRRSDHALDCSTIKADSLWLDDMTVTGTVDFTSAQVRVLHDDPLNWPDRMFLDGCTYDDLDPYTAARGSSGRLAWLARTDTGYRPQPYEQLAAYYRRLGHEEEARQVLVAKERCHRAELGALGKTAGYVLDGLVGYGYRPRRAFMWLVSLFAVASVYFTFNRPAPLDPAQHPHYQPVLYAADLVIPIVGLGQGDIWAPAGACQWFAAAFTVLGWIFATAVVAGITRVLTRS